MKSILSLFLGALLYWPAQAQTSEGNEFWLAYMENLTLLANDDPIFTVVVQSEASTSGTIEVPATGLTIPFDVDANTISEIELPSAIWYSEGSDVTADRGIRIQTETPVRAAAFHYRAYFTESTHLLPAPALGTEYLTTCYKDDAGDDPSSFVVVSTADGTTVEIIPSTLTNGLRPAGVPYTVTLNEGQTYQVQANGDLSGSRIRSLSGQPIAVFSGARQADILDCSSGADSHVYEQSIPVEQWGSRYPFVPFAGQGTDVLRILAAEEGTNVYFDCEKQAVLEAGSFLAVQRSAPTLITADGPIAVTQYNTSGSCSPSGNGDPNALRLFPSNYRIDESRFLSPGRFNPDINSTYFNTHFVNIVSPADEAGDILLDGSAIPGGFTPFSADPAFAYAQVQLSPGVHQLSGSGGFQAYSYGFGFADAYTTHLGYSQVLEENSACLIPRVEGLFCVDSTLTFSYQTDVKAVSVNWDFGNGQTASADTAFTFYDSPGTYTVTLRLTDSLGNTFEESLSIEVKDCGATPCQELELSISAEDTGCTGDLIPFSFAFEGEASDAFWQFSNGASAEGFAPEVSFGAPGTYGVSLEIKDDLNCSYTASTEITIANCSGCQPEVVDLTFEGVPCVDSTLLLGLPEFLEEESFLLLEWTVNGTFFGESAPLSVPLQEAGLLTVAFEAITIGECFYFGEIEILVEDCGDNPCINLPPVNIVATSPYCIGEPLSFSAQPSAILAAYEWSANNGDTGNEAIFTTIYNSPGVATIELLAFDANGCSYGSVVEADLISCGDPCEDLPPVSIELEGELCLDSTLQASAATEAELQAFTWNFGNGESSNAATPSFSYEEEGLYTISLAASDESGCLYSEQLEFIIEDCSPPDPCADVPDLRILGGDSLLCTGEEVAFQAEGPDNLVLYDWQLGNGERSEEATASTVYEEPGLYSVILVAVDDESCSYSDNFSFELQFCEPEGGCSYEFPNAFTPNGDGTNDQFSLLSNCPMESYQLRIFNRWGQLVFETEQADQGWDGTFEGKAAPSEVYYYTATISDPNGNLEQRQGDLSLLR